MTRRRSIHRLDHYGRRQPVGTLDRIGLLLVLNRSLPAGERICWGRALLTIITLFAVATGVAVTL